MIQQLHAYRTPPGWHPGAPWLVQTLWFCGGAPLRGFGARIGRGCRLKPGLRVTFPWRLTVGDHCWLGEDAWIDNLAAVTLADRVCVSQGAYLCTGNHDYRSAAFAQRLAPIAVGPDAWIGAILRGNPAVVVGQR